MKLAYFHNKPELSGDPGLEAILAGLRSAGCCVYDVTQGLQPGTGMLLSFGGDGTFLSAVRYAAEAGVPVAGVNFGRVGFLSDIAPESVVDALTQGNYEVEHRNLLRVECLGAEGPGWPYAVNEVSVNRSGEGMLGVSVELDGVTLPTYWADGLLVSTSSGSTAYSLSAGGPICTPDLEAFVIAPVAPHNLNMRPLVVPSSSDIFLKPCDRGGSGVSLALDNRRMTLPGGCSVRVGKAPFKLARVKLTGSNFIAALNQKLFWGEDLRNK